jgi:hypothetical protein
VETKRERWHDTPGFSARRPAAKPGATKTVNALATVKIDFTPEHRQPPAARVLAASVVAIAGSLLADAVLVAVGTAVFASTKGYTHFRFSDYSRLTIVGVIIACAAWPIVTRISSAPRWLFLRMAIAVTAVLLLPDVAILAKGQPPRAVFILMLMHLAIGIVTYLSLVCIAPVGRSGQSAKA